VNKIIFFFILIILLNYNVNLAFPDTDDSSIDCSKISQTNPNSKIFCKGGTWFQGEIELQIVKDSPGNYRFIQYGKRKDINGNEFSVINSSVTKNKQNLLIAKQRFKGGELATVNADLDKINEVDKWEAEKSGPVSQPIVQAFEKPQIDIKRVLVPSGYLNQNGSESLLVKYEFTTYKTTKDVNGIEHTVIDKEQQYTKEELEKLKMQQEAIRDPYNPHPVFEKQLVTIRTMLEKINELENQK